MSLITLTSSTNTSDPRPTDPAIIKNNFKDGLMIRKGSEVGLVNLTINKQAFFEIQTGVNDTFVWRLGDRQNYEQHTVVAGPGNYTGSALATELQTKLRASTVIGVYKDEWTVVFDPTAQDGKGGFTINYAVAATPPEGVQDFTQYGGSLLISNQALPLGSEISSNVSGTAFNAIPANIATASKGIFGNGGTIEAVCVPFTVPTEGDVNTAIVLGGAGDFTEVVLGVDGRTFDFTTTAPGAIFNRGWIYTLVFQNGDPNEYFGPGSDEGIAKGNYFHSMDGAGQVSTGSIFKFAPDGVAVGNASFNDNPSGGRGPYNGLGTQYKKSAGNLVVDENRGFFATQQVGYVRDILYQGQNNYPGNANAEITGDVGGFDIQFEITSIGAEASGSDVSVSLNQLKQTQGTSFPNANWRTASTAIFSDLSSSAFSNRTGAQDWQTFSGLDHIKLVVQVDNLRNISCKISHDSVGDGNFTEEQTLAKTGTQGFTSTIKETSYPLRPVYCGNGSGYYTNNITVARMTGIFDSREHLQQYTDAADGDGNLEATPLTLSSLFKFGLITADEIGAGAGQIPQADYNGVQGNIQNVIGVKNYYVFPSQDPAQSVITSISEPFISISEPSLFLELMDFNIRGHNGKTGDNCKVIAVIPKEELQTGNNQGVLHYYPNFPVFIDLNIPEDKVYYDLNALLRTPDGTIANDLINPTEITLLIRESEESRQERLMRKQAEIISTAVANRNETKINQIGVNNPRI